MPLKSINPADGTLLSEFPEMDDQEIEAILDDCQADWESWKTTSFEHRKNLMLQAAEILRSRKDHLAGLMCAEMGKVYASGLSEVEKCAWVCEYYAEHADQFLSSEAVETDAANSYVAFRPIGIVLAVMPWNFPLWQVFRFAAPALMAGNAGVLKHASNVMGCALAIEEVFRQAGFPAHLFRNLRISSGKVAQVIAHPHVKAVTLTGSTPAGKAVAAKAGEHLKKTVLELGGSDPYVVLEDADLDLAAAKCVTSRLINTGQSCIAAKRFIVVEQVREAFTRKVLDLMQKQTLGDPMAEGTDLGPMAREDLRDELHAQVMRSVDLGARCLLGGEIPPQKGAWYPATLLVDVRPGMPAWEEELFGPVAAIIAAKDEEDAIRIANATEFGLGAAVFTANTARGERIAERELEAGCCFVNDFVRSDPRLPFGGIGESGYGRELGPFGIREFVNIKTVYRA